MIHRDDGLAFEAVEPGTFVPLEGSEAGLPHHIFSERELARELERLRSWKSTNGRKAKY